MTAKKSTSAAPKKKAAAKKAAAPAKKKAAKKKAAAKPKATPQSAAKPAPKSASGKGSVSSMAVTLGHIFSLRPRVDRSFRQSNLAEAKRALEGESYTDVREAARAVADEALKITRDGAGRPDRRKR